MIQKLTLNNFKIHNHLELPLGALTLLTGANGMGKSSVIQSLLLLRQTFWKNNSEYGLVTNGNLCSLGAQIDILCQSSKSNTIDIDLTTTEGNLDFSFECDDSRPQSSTIETKSIPSIEEIKKCVLFTKDFQYASADRFGPKEFYKPQEDVVKRDRQISFEKGQCEYTVDFLYTHGTEAVEIEELLCPQEESDEPIDNTLAEQVRLWLRFISPDINIHIETVSEGKLLKLNYNFSREGGMRTSDMSAVNVGYGVSYALPIIVAILSAKPGALILIENPEAHIHPGAISKLMDLIIKAVKAGIQIIIETHSDHIINGMLVKVAQENREEVKPSVLTKDITKVYFFSRNNEDHTSKVINLKILEDGNIVSSSYIDEDGDEQVVLAPEGFFDQFNIDIKKILGY